MVGHAGRSARTPAQRLTSEDGFTLAELVIVMVVLSILSTITLPMFVAQQMRGQDAAAKANARNLTIAVRQCHEGSSAADYTSCNTLAELTSGGSDPLSVPYGSDPGEAEVVAATTTTFRIVSRSHSGNEFSVKLDATGDTTRECTTANSAGCPPDGQW